jgi:hypothetical protein
MKKENKVISGFYKIPGRRIFGFRKGKNQQTFILEKDVIKELPNEGMQSGNISAGLFR